MSPYIFIRLRVKLHSAAVTLTLPDRHGQPAEDARNLNQSWETEAKNNNNTHPGSFLFVFFSSLAPAGSARAAVCVTFSPHEASAGPRSLFVIVSVWLRGRRSACLRPRWPPAGMWTPPDVRGGVKRVFVRLNHNSHHNQTMGFFLSSFIFLILEFSHWSCLSVAKRSFPLSAVLQSNQ